MATRKKKKVVHASRKRHQIKKSSYVNVFVLAFVITLVIQLGLAIASTETYKVLGTSTYLAMSGSESGTFEEVKVEENYETASVIEKQRLEEKRLWEEKYREEKLRKEALLKEKYAEEKRLKEERKLKESQQTKNKSFTDTTEGQCKGPDNKIFITRYKDCKELNTAWNKDVRFIPLETKTETSKQVSEKQKPIPSGMQKPEKREIPVGNETKFKQEIKPDEKRTEVKLPEGERIKTRTKDGKSQIDITQGGVKTKLEFREEKVVIKAEQEDGTETELEDETFMHIEDRLAKENIRIATAGANKFMLKKGFTAAVSDFPVSVDLSTNKLYVTTPAGEKALTVLPEQAVESIIAADIVDTIEEPSESDATVINTIPEAQQTVRLGTVNGIPVYKVKGVSQQKFLGFIPVKINKDITVSAETGNAVSIDQSFGAKFLDALAF